MFLTLISIGHLREISLHILAQTSFNQFVFLIHALLINFALCYIVQCTKLPLQTYHCLIIKYVCRRKTNNLDLEGLLRVDINRKQINNQCIKCSLKIGKTKKYPDQLNQRKPRLLIILNKVMRPKDVRRNVLRIALRG